MTQVEPWATISDDGSYRYALGRALPRSTETIPDKRAIFVMLNPSTADHREDDPTIRRCLGFAARERCEYLTVLNLFALRATQPTELSKVEDPVGIDNGAAWGKVFAERDLHQDLVIAAWGASVPSGTWQAYVGQRHKELADAGAYCFGTTAGGYPRHPLYLAKDTPLVRLPGGQAGT